MNNPIERPEITKVLGIPITVFLAFLAYGITGIWWGSDLTARLSAVEQKISRLPPVEIRNNTMRITRLEEALRAQGAQLGRIETHLDRLAGVRTRVSP